MKMKKYWLTFTITALLAGACSNEEVTMQEVDSGTGIEFRSLTDKTITRAAITDETSIVGFTVTGWWDKTGADPTTNYGSNVATDGVYLFNGFTIARGEDEATKWDYSPKRYWPANGKGTVDFFAYSPASSRNLNAGLEDFNGATIEYTVPQIAETGLQQEDFLVAKSTRLTSGTVALNFQHALSRVKFFAKKSNAGITYVIDKVELINLASTATLDLVNDFPNQTSLAYTGTTPLILWEKDNNSVVNYEVDMSGSPVYLLSDFNSILGTTSAVMVMPQKTTLATTGTVAPSGGEFAIAVSYRAYIGTFYYAGTPTTSKTQYFAVKDPVYSSGDGIAFEIGRQYNFYLTFGGEASATAITFQVNVSDWASEEGHIVPELDDYTTYFGQALITLVNKVSNNSDGITNGNGDGKVTYDELAAAKLIAYKSDDIKKVEPFKGIEYLFAMTTLNFIAVEIVPDNKIPDLVLHSTNIALNTINFLYSNLAMDTLDVSALPANVVNITTSSNTATITTLIKRAGQTVVKTGNFNITDEIEK